MFAVTAATFAQSSAPAKAKPKKKPAAHDAVREEVKQLHDLVATQQQQLEAQHQQVDDLKSQLQQLIEVTQQANAAAQKVQGSADQAQSTAVQAQQAAAEAQRSADNASSSAVEAKTAITAVSAQTRDEGKRLGALQDLVGRFRFSGDVRVRGEDSFQDGVPTRNRARIRVRFGVDGVLSENFTGGFALASGTLGDPTTTNETLTNFFDRKTIGLDRGYVAYNPVAARWLSLTGGKFAYTWQRTSLTFDPDINPEGFSEKFSFDLHTPVLKNFTAQGLQLLYNEVTRGNDSFAVGGQVSSVIKLGPLTSTPSFTLLDWHFTDALLAASAFATQATTSGNPAIPISGEGPGCATGFGLASVPACAFAANGLTNATFTGANGVRHFWSGFEYADLIVNNTIKTGAERFPVNLILEYEDNLKAASHPLNATGVVLSSLGSQGKAYLGDISLGQSKKKGDLQVGYSFWRLEQDAIIASWAESDQRAPTNVLQNRFYAIWRPQQHVVAQYTLWVGHTLNSNLEHAVLATGVSPGQTEPDLKRQQFDLIYSF
jgi:regulator of replication initiation timing